MQKELHHSLVDESDQAGSKRTLLELLRDIPHVQLIVQVKPDSSGKTMTAKCPKASNFCYFLLINLD